MKIKCTELSGPPLRWAVAKALGFHIEPASFPLIEVERHDKTGSPLETFCPDEDANQGVPLLQQACIDLLWIDDSTWVGRANDQDLSMPGPAMLIAGLRCLVATHLGHEVEVPKEILPLALARGGDYCNAQRGVVTIVEFDASFVLCHPQGGGLQMRMTRESFERQFSPWIPTAATVAMVTTDGFPADVSFSAFVKERRWNGWLMPFFTKEVGLQIVPHVIGLTYDEAEDAFVYRDVYASECAGGDAERDIFPAQQIQTPDGTQLLYGIGAGSWTWETA